MTTVETRYKDIWYNKIPDITNWFLWSQWIKFLCFVLFIDYWYNKISDIKNTISLSQWSRYTEFPLYLQLLICTLSSEASSTVLLTITIIAYILIKQNIWYNKHNFPVPRMISVQDKFRSGGLKSLARIFFPLLARKSSGFARILLFFLFPENGYLNNSRGAAAPLSPMGRTPMQGSRYFYRISNVQIGLSQFSISKCLEQYTNLGHRLSLEHQLRRGTTVRNLPLIHSISTYSSIHVQMRW